MNQTSKEYKNPGGWSQPEARSKPSDLRHSDLTMSDQNPAA